MPMTIRLFFYQGALQFRASEENEDQDETAYTGRGVPRTTSNGVDMRHNMVAAKAAAKGVKGGDDGEVKVVPAAQWMAMAPPGTVEYEQAPG